MSNLLLDFLPEFVTLSGREYFVDTDFRTMIILEKIITDSTLDNADRVHMMIDLVYSYKRPTKIAEAVSGLLYIYNCGKPLDSAKRSSKNGNIELRPIMIYDFEYDAPYIYGAFLSQYGIDLNDVEYLHWWKFVALFKSLPNTCKICEIMGYRAADPSKIKNAEERQRISKLKKIYDLPQNYSFEEKVAMAGASFAGGIL